MVSRATIMLTLSTRTLTLCLAFLFSLYQFAVVRSFHRAPRQPDEHTEVPENSLDVASIATSLVVDYVSVGSLSRLDLVELQQRTFLSHSIVRNVFNATELDDADPDCYRNLTWEQAKKVSRFCRNTRRYNARNSTVFHYLLNIFAREQWLEKKSNPAGWMCAQPRPFQGLSKAIKHYAYTQQELPDWLVIGDDDTYVNMELFRRNFEDRDSSELEVVAGCLVRQPIHMVNFTFPWGGFGAFFSKGSLEKLRRPIYCPSDDDKATCDRLNENLVGELGYFENGMSLVELIHAYVSKEPYREVERWTQGFCMHSDWVTGYFVNFYNVSRHVDEPYYAAVPQARMAPYIGGSEFYRRAEGICQYEGTCREGSEICHKMPAKWIEEETERWRFQAPQHYKPSSQLFSESRANRRSKSV